MKMFYLLLVAYIISLYAGQPDGLGENEFAFLEQAQSGSHAPIMLG